MTVRQMSMGDGTFVLGQTTPTGTGLYVSGQATNVVFSFGASTTDSRFTLAGTSIAGTYTEKPAIKGKLLQDFGTLSAITATASPVQDYLITHKGENVGFYFQPWDASKSAINGHLVCQPTDLGGDVDNPGDADFSFSVVDYQMLTTSKP